MTVRWPGEYRGDADVAQVTGHAAERRRGPKGESMRRTRARLFGAGLVGLALLAASCGGDDSDSAEGGSTGNTVDAGVKSGVQDALGGSTTTGGATATTAPPASMDAWESLWTQPRDAVVKRI